MSLHRGSGQAVVRFVEHRKGGRRGLVDDRYLGVFGSAGVRERYEEEIGEWIERSLPVGWAPAGWEPARTGHEGVLTVEELVAGYRRHLAGGWGAGWWHAGAEPYVVREYREALERAHELMRKGRRRGDWSGDRRISREGKRLVLDARRRFGHLDDRLEKLWAARVLNDLVRDYGPMAAAVLGDRELRQLRGRWAADGRSLGDRKAGMVVVKDAYCYVVRREPRAPWDLDRGYLEEHAHEYGLDLGIVGADGRWVRTG